MFKIQNKMTGQTGHSFIWLYHQDTLILVKTHFHLRGLIYIRSCIPYGKEKKEERIRHTLQVSGFLNEKDAPLLLGEGKGVP